MAEEFDYSDFKKRPPGDNLLAQIRAEAQKLLDEEAEVARLEAELEIAQGNATRTRTITLPNLMEQAETKHHISDDGLDIKVKDVIRAGIPKDNPEPTLTWLEEHKQGDIIKRTIVISFNRDESTWANKFIKDLLQRKKPVRAEFKKTVHPQTLLATLREMYENGVDIPLSTLFNGIRQKEAEVTVPKAKAKAKK